MGMELYHRSMLSQFQSPFGNPKRVPLALHRRAEVVDTPGAHSNVTPTQYEDSFVVDDDDEEEEDEDEEDEDEEEEEKEAEEKKRRRKHQKQLKAEDTCVKAHSKRRGAAKKPTRRGAVLQLSASSESREDHGGGEDEGDPAEEEGGPTGLTLEHEDVCRECGREDGRDLLCCDGCPAAVHLRCVGLWKVPKGTSLQGGAHRDVFDGAHVFVHLPVFNQQEIGFAASAALASSLCISTVHLCMCTCVHMCGLSWPQTPTLCYCCCCLTRESVQPIHNTYKRCHCANFAWVTHTYNSTGRYDDVGMMRMMIQQHSTGGTGTVAYENTPTTTI